MSHRISVKVSKLYQIAVPALARQLLNIKSVDSFRVMELPVYAP